MPRAQTSKGTTEKKKAAPPVCSAESGRQKKRAGTALSYGEVEHQAQEATKNHSKAATTLQKYDLYWDQLVAYVKAVVHQERKKEKAWEKEQVKAPHPENDIDDNAPDFPEGNDSSSTGAPQNTEDTGRPSDDSIPAKPGLSTLMDPEFPLALVGFPKGCTPSAVTMFIWHKCFEEGCQIGVADSIVASVINTYDLIGTLVRGDKYRGKWERDSATGEWKGNPGRSAKVKDMVSAVKKRNTSKTPDRKHSRAMSYKDMQTIYGYIQGLGSTPESTSGTKPSMAPPMSLSKTAESLYFMALASLGFVIWTRNSETCQLQFKHFDFKAEPKECANGQTFPRYSINVRHRKNWQHKMETGEVGLEGHFYNIYEHPETPAIDLYRHISRWKEFYEDHVLRRPLNPEDYMFPTINFDKLTADPSTPITRQAVQKLITAYATAAGLSQAHKYTTHCFRRGGAQYRFMYAPIGKRWTMSRIRWWGGWAEGESGDTLIRYLLDELHTYEEDHRDALCPVDESANNAHMGEDRSLRPFTADDGRKLYEHCNTLLRAQFDNLTEKVMNRIVTPKEHPSVAPGYQTAATVTPVHPAYAPAPVSTGPYTPSNQSVPYTPQNSAHDRQHARPPAPPHHLSVDFHQPTAYPSAPPKSIYSRYSPYSYPPAHPYHSSQSSHPSPSYWPAPPSSYGLPLGQIPTQPPQAQMYPSFPVADSNELPLPAHDLRWQSAAIAEVQSSRTTTPVLRGEKHVLPKMPRGKAKLPHGWKLVVKDWEEAQPNRCPIPLRDWDMDWLHETKQAQAYHVRKTIALEFIETYGRDESAFLNAYPSHTRGITPLYEAIRISHQALGTAKVRAKRKIGPMPCPSVSNAGGDESSDESSDSDMDTT
ncbi:hypothetical protein D9611_013216 [Ephemerocybe angulata]|uniref:Uncharacterized protein n=1 Tax=Ephemerocybe angulata TaxID=980116 RepID=A0A8H5BU15_9AGAR|nr:hypothetical protein D9611_013216 [Tulosesus angulatus]